MPSSCTTQTVAPDHLLFILENGNLNNNFGSNVETALDIEAAHGVADARRDEVLRRRLRRRRRRRAPASTNAGCNGSDVGLEETIEDAANDPTLHSVSNSWAFGGEAEWGAADPFLIAAENSLAIGAAAGTTFYFSTGDSGTYQSGYPSDSPHVVAVGGTSTYSTSDPAHVEHVDDVERRRQLVLERHRPAGVADRRRRRGQRAVPGPRRSRTSRRSPTRTPASASPSTHERRRAARRAGQVGGTSLAAPVMNGLQAVTQNFVAAQTYPGPTPQLGFVAPVHLPDGQQRRTTRATSATSSAATPPTRRAGPTATPPTKGWDAATGWGEPDWFNFTHRLRAAARRDQPERAGVALDRHFTLDVREDAEQLDRARLLVPVGVDLLRGRRRLGRHAVVRQVPRRRRVGRGEHVLQEHRRRRELVPVEQRHVLDRLHERAARASRSGRAGASGGRPTAATTWTDVATAPGNNKPLTQVTCPSSSICYAVGDRGNAMKSTDGGQTWSWLNSDRRQPDLRALLPEHDGLLRDRHLRARRQDRPTAARRWTWQTTPITTPGVAVPGSGGPNPFAGLMAISCSDADTCVASGLYASSPARRSRAPIRRSSRRPTAARPGRVRRATRGTGQLPARDLVPARARRRARRSAAAAGSSRRPTSSTWTPQTSNTTNMLNSVALPEHVVLHRGRPERHRRRLQRHDVDGDHRQRRHGHARRRRPATATSSATRPASRASRC